MSQSVYSGTVHFVSLQFYNSVLLCEKLPQSFCHFVRTRKKPKLDTSSPTARTFQTKWLLQNAFLCRDRTLPMRRDTRSHFKCWAGVQVPGHKARWSRHHVAWITCGVMPSNQQHVPQLVRPNEKFRPGM